MNGLQIAGCALLLLAASSEVPGATHRIVVDTDFGLPPQDDGLALALALSSPELEILGVTTVAGNYNLPRSNAEVLRMLEIVHRESIPVFAGAASPLVHRKDDYAMKHWGKWWSDEPPAPPLGRFAAKTLESESAAEFLVRIVTANPGQVEIVALGPLTNIALAIQREPSFAGAVKSMVVMGGAVALLADGAGNITPNAEFNFWVDPEAARTVLRSGIPIQLSPLNVSRTTRLDKEAYERLVAEDTALSGLIRQQMGPRFAARPDLTIAMYDEVAVASLIDPTLVRTQRLIVDVDVAPGINYGTSVGGREPWPGAEGARTCDVQYGLDWERFIKLFIDRVGRQ
jgi:inosine-uridine nucleoside N-ribohydrolase